MSIQRIALLGSGNVATRLGHAFTQHGLEITGIYSRNASSASELANELNGEVVSQPNDLPNSDLYLLAVKDDAIANIAQNLRISSGIVAHTSGSVNIDVLRSIGSDFGSFYPLQTFSKNRDIDLDRIPICVEANSITAQQHLMSLAQNLSAAAQLMDSAQRKRVHLAAVFANNFSNHMFQIAQEILQEYNIGFEILQPLIEETVSKSMESDPRSAQTGPALRNDETIMNSHLELLKDHELRQKIYTLVSQSIQASNE